MVFGQRWNKSVAQHAPPIRASYKSSNDVGEQNSRQPLHDHRDLMITKSDSRVGDADTENHYVDERIDSAQHLGLARHAAKLGPDDQRDRLQQAERARSAYP